MTLRVIVEPSDADLATIEASDLANPFCCARYVAARRERGATVVLFSRTDAHGVSIGTIGYVRGRVLGRTLEITSAPPVAADCGFWDGVLEFCHEHRIADVEIDSYASSQVSLPAWAGQSSLRERTEWVIQLKGDAAPAFASNHRRNIKKAQKHGVTTTSTTDEAATVTHARLMNASMVRRSARGESVPEIAARDTRYDQALLATGAGRLYQASFEGEAVSSLMVLMGKRGAYYQSAGTSPRGMEIGASTLLVSAAIRDLAEHGKTVFNLGGAGPESEGLRRFKAGFGAEPVMLVAGSYEVASRFHKNLRTAIRLVRRPSDLRVTIARRLAALFTATAAVNLS